MTQNCNNSEQSKQKKTCLWCGKEVTKNQQKFCCRECRLEYHENTERTCELCGKTFTYRWSWALCRECYREGDRDKRRLSQAQKRRMKSKGKRTSLDEYIEYKVTHPQGYSYGYYMAKLCGRV